MSASLSNQQIVENLYKAFMSGQIQAILDSCHPDTVWSNAYPTTLPFGGEFRGHEGALRFLGAISSALEVKAFEISQDVAQGDTVVALGKERSVTRKTGKGIEFHFAHVFTLRDGKVATFRVYSDTATVAGVFSPQG